MSSEHEEMYLLLASDDEEWVRPQQASAAIVEAVTDGTGLDRERLDPIDAYVDADELEAVIDGADDEVTFTVEGHSVTVTADGDIDVSG